jgi:hypothetical protein
MALPNTTITATSPAKLVAAENPIVISLATGTVGSPQFARMRLDNFDVETDGLAITFSLTYPTPYTKVFTARDFPNNDSYFFTGTIKDRDGNTIDTVSQAEVTQSLAEAVQKDAFISRYYHINYTGGTRVWLISKEASSRFNLSGKVATTNGSEISPVNVATGRSEYEGGAIQDYSLFVETFTGDGYEYGDNINISAFNRITEIVLPYSNDNINHFDASAIAKAFVSTPRPDFDLTGFTVASYMKPFGFRYGEIYPVVPNENTKKKFYKGLINPVWVANAALEFEDANSLVHLTGTTDGGEVSDVPFLTSSPNPKMTNRASKELLYLLLPSFIAGGQKLFTDLTFWDGTELNDYFLKEYPVGFGGLHCINTSFQTLALNSIESSYARKIKYADVYLRSGSANQLLLNNEFESNLNSWSLASVGTGSTAIGWDSGNGGRAIMHLGTYVTAIVQDDWGFNSDLNGWYNQFGTSNPDQWHWSSDWAGSARIYTNNGTSNPPNLRNDSITPFGEMFYVVVGYVVNPPLPNSANLNMRVVMYDGSNNLIAVSQFTTTFNGGQQFHSLTFNDPAVYNNVESIAIVLHSTNFNATDTIHIMFVQTAIEGAITFTRSYDLKQENLTLEPSMDYVLRWDATFSGGTATVLKARFYDSGGSNVGSEMTLATGGAGHYTGSTAISDTLNEDIFGVKFWVENTTDTAGQVTLYFNSFSIDQTVATENTTLVKTYQFPYTDPSNTFGVAFLNKLGTFDTFEFIGLQEETIDRTSKQITLPLTPNADGSYSEGFKYSANYDVQVTKKVVLNSGLLDQAHFDWLQELMASNEIYSYSEEFVNYLKLDSFKYQKNTQSNEYNIEVTFIQTIYESNVSI